MANESSFLADALKGEAAYASPDLRDSLRNAEIFSDVLTEASIECDTLEGGPMTRGELCALLAVMRLLYTPNAQRS